MVAMAACGDSGSGGGGSNDGGSGGSGAGNAGGSGAGNAGGSGASFVGPGGSGDGGGQQEGLDVQPADLQTITVNMGTQSPNVMFTATLDGQPVNAAWAVDKGNIGTVPTADASSVTLTPTGTTGGLVKITAGVNMQTVEREVMVKLVGDQNGFDPSNPADAAQVPDSVADLTTGGGVAGVGGEGLGGPVVDLATLDALDAPSGDGSAQGLKLTYPYDKTVWPRGLLAPNLMWRWAAPGGGGDADAVKIELTTTTGSFEYKGTFARPAILAQTGKPFIRHPIPQSVWAAATNSAGGADKVTVKLTIAKDGVAYGPIEQTWTIAPARLSGIIYYNSYGTQLAHNYTGAVGGDGTFGGAVLSIHAGDPGPALTAGSDGNGTNCRVCHSVSANGSRLIAQRGDNSAQSSLYELTPAGATESFLTVGAQFPAISPDGSMMLTPAATLHALPGATALPATGLTSVSTSIGTPAFSPDGKLAVFNMLTGTVANPKQKLVVMGFDPITYAFSNAVEVVDYTGEAAEVRPGWPAFFPDGNSVVFHKQTAAGVDGNNLGDLRSRKGARAELAWTKTTDAASVTRLDQANGYDENGEVYLPKLDAPINLTCTADAVSVGQIDADHADDVHLNYEPTVNPIASGGYAWVVFTSRRLYGSVAEIPPFCSDPRGVDLIQNVTTKKLWVAAIDLSGEPGADASHPAFYLPGQELLAGNSRAFWVLDPCKMDGEGCEAGDECCNGYCQPNDEGELVCSNEPPDTNCSQPQEICETAADCCDAENLCVNGFCTQQGPT